VIKNNQFEAAIAMLRRFEFRKSKEDVDLLKSFRINIKDKIIILDFEKEKTLLKKLSEMVTNTDYDKGDTLKLVVGSSSIKVFIDKKNEEKIKKLTRSYQLNNTLDNMSEISMTFADESIDTKGIICAITSELAINDVVINEMLTASPELLIYVGEEHVLKAYDVLKQLQK